MERYRTPSRKNLEQLAQEAENSELVSENVQEQFVLAILRDLERGRMMSGEFGEVAWTWREADGEIYLDVVRIADDGKEDHMTAWFVTDASGDLMLTASP